MPTLGNSSHIHLCDHPNLVFRKKQNTLETMNLLSILISAILLLTTFTSANNLPDDDQNPPSVSRSTVDFKIRVTVAEPECGIPSAIYQVFDDGISKVADLQPIQSDERMVVHTENMKTIKRVLGEVLQNNVQIKSVKEEEVDDCHMHLTYTFQ